MTSQRGPRQPVTTLYDQGGIIYPGHVAINATGAHEQILGGPVTSRRGPHQPVTMPVIRRLGPYDLDNPVSLVALRSLERAAAMEDAIKAIVRILRRPGALCLLAKLDAYAHEDISRWENEGGAT